MELKHTPRRWLALASTGLTAALGLGAYSAVAAPAPHPQRVAQPQRTAHKVTTSDFGVVIGPFRARDGFKAEIEAVDCGTKGGGVLVAYAKGDARVSLAHTYGRAGGSCTVSKTLKAATLKVTWGTVLDLDVTVATTTKLKKVHVATCNSTYLEYRTAKARGTAVTAIHPQAFGRLHAGGDAVRLFAYVSGGCKTSSSSSSNGTLPVAKTRTRRSGFAIAREAAALPTLSGLPAAATATPAAASSAAATRAAVTPAVTTTTTTATTTTPTTTTTTPTTTTTTSTTSTTPTAPPSVTADGSGTQFYAVFNQAANLVISAAAEKGHTPVTLIDDDAKDSPAAKVEGTMQVEIAEPGAFTAAAGDDSAKLTSGASFVSGTLKFTAATACHGTSGALDGTLAGAITVKDPVFGTLTYNGPKAVDAAVGNLDASLSGC